MDEVKELLDKLDTQLDGVESYWKQLREIGMRPEFNNENIVGIRLGRQLRVKAKMNLVTNLKYMREDLQILKRRFEEVQNSTHD